MTTSGVANRFVWRQASAGRVLVAETLALSARHVFTAREFGDDDDGPVGLSEALGVPVGALVRVRQVHGNRVLLVKPGVDVMRGSAADAIVSTDASRAIAVSVADCVPVLVADHERRVVAAVHAGWRGTAAGVVAATVAAIERAGVPAAELVAAIGPSIGPCCYQVDRPVRDAFLSSPPDADGWFAPDGEGHWRFDLWEANRAALLRAGVRPEAVHVARLCTFDHPADWYSFRRDGSRAGRLFAAIRLEPSDR